MPASLEEKWIKAFWFFFSKKNKHFFLKKEAKTFSHLNIDRRHDPEPIA
jgi:hypothetical protein